MNPIRRLFCFATIIVLSHGAPSAVASESTFAAIINRAATAFDARQPNEILSAIHTQSPLYLQTIQQIQQTFHIYDIEVLVRDFHDLGSDGKDHFGTVIQSFRKRTGPAYQNSETKSVVVFRMEEGTWKIWAMLPIEVTPIQ